MQAVRTAARKTKMGQNRAAYNEYVVLCDSKGKRPSTYIGFHKGRI